MTPRPTDLPFPDDTADSANLPDASESAFHHIPVLLEAVLEGLAIQPQGRYLDATLGGGGHSRRILDSAPGVEVVGLDQDARAIAAAQKNLGEFGDRIQFHHTNFVDFDPKGETFDGILADLGVSSAQFDQAERGFSFRQTAPLDMRMDNRQSLTAADLVNHGDEVELANIFYTYGEERLSRRIARRIVEQRPFQTTTELAEAIAYSVPKKYRYGRIHPATRVFQALRIAVNQELDALDQFLEKAPTWLKPNGRLVIISFHSLEDRKVKQAFRDRPDLAIITKKPITADEVEIAQNSRSRSAKLRVASRLPT